MKLSPVFAGLLMASTIIGASAPSLAADSKSMQADPRAIVVEDVSHADFATTLKTLKEQLTADGWNLVAEINLGERLAKKNVRIPGGLVILEMTSGGNTLPLLKNEETRYVSALMPCSVSVYGMSDGRVIISRMNANLMAGMMDPRLAEAMKKSSAQLDASIARALTKTSSTNP
jgi:uncharacterized protein (DUF302 family)